MSRREVRSYPERPNWVLAASRIAARVASALRLRGAEGARLTVAMSLMPTPLGERRSGPRRNDDAHALVAVDEGREAAHRLFHQFDPREALQDFFPDDGQLHLRDAIADAAVDAEPERHVLARPLPVDDEGVGVLDLRLVAVA